jgi:hypothetical protein
VSAAIADDDGHSIRIVQEDEGLTMRDRFAMAAMSGAVLGRPASMVFPLLAKRAYEIADAMLEARGKERRDG